MLDKIIPINHFLADVEYFDVHMLYTDKVILSAS